jgi:dihydroorotate dehydrogenase (NAD+) catalytic subunit
MLVLSGRIQGFMPDIETQKPILGSWGAIGGGWALPASLYWVSKCWRNVSKEVPIIGTNGARSAEDVLRFLLSGARAVELASAVITNGVQIFPEMLAGIQSYCERKNVLQVQDLIGKAADCSLAYSDIPAKANQRFPWEL